MTVENQTVPIVDFGAFLHGDSESKKSAAAAMDDAFRNVGFIYLSNYGIDDSRVKEAFQWNKKFFDLPYKTKMLAPHPPGGSHHRGYSGVSKEKVSQNVFDEKEIEELRQIPDFKESYESGNVDDEAQPNIWLPEDRLPGFRNFMEGFFKDCEGLVHKVLDCLSLALNLDKSLSPTHSKSLFQLRILHYPSIPKKDLLQNRSARINAHSDFGTLTLLFQDAVGGLEVEDPHQPGVFRPVKPIPGTVLVNIGDLMMRWSNDRWRSTVHRVVAPIEHAEVVGEKENGEEKVMVPDRYSIPFFATANMDQEIDALPGCWSEDNPKRYEKTTAWGYVQMRMAALY